MSLATKFNHTRFKQDYAVGKVAEIAFIESISQWGFKTRQIAPDDKSFYQYDIQLDIPDSPDPRIITMDKWEIKCDMGSQGKNGNIPIQFWASSKTQTDKFLPGTKEKNMSCNSGIYKTESDLYCVFNPHDSKFYYAESTWLRIYLEINPRLRKVLANTHKPEQTDIALIPKSVWENEFYTLSYSEPVYSPI